MNYETLLVRKEEGVTTVTLNRPEKRNALNPKMHEEGYSCLTELATDPETRVVVITGAGDHFCSGNDLKEYFWDMDSKPQEYRERIYRISSEWRGSLMRSYPKPIISSVNGYCFGGGLIFCTAADISIAAEDAIFGLSEINFGRFPGGEVTKAMIEYMLPKHALYYMMTGKHFDGREAERIGLIFKAVPRDQLAKETELIARELVQKEPHAMRTLREVYYLSITMDWQQALAFAWHRGNTLIREQGGRPGIRRFLDKEFRPGFETYDPTNDSGSTTKPR